MGRGVSGAVVEVVRILHTESEAYSLEANPDRTEALYANLVEALHRVRVPVAAG